MVWRWSNAPMLAVAFMLATALFLALRKEARRAAVLPLLWSLLPLLGLFALSFAVPLYLDRYLLFAAPGFLLMVAVVLPRLLPRLPWLLPLVAVVAMGATFRPVNPSVPQPGAVARVVEAWAPNGGGVQVLVFPHWYDLSLLWYLDRERFAMPAALRGDAGVLREGAVDAIGLVLVQGPGRLPEEEAQRLEDVRREHDLLEEATPDRGTRVERRSR
jgi:hypothetical protein